MAFEKIKYDLETGKKMLSVLIDPENYSDDKLEKVICNCNDFQVDFILIGGSLVSSRADELIIDLKKNVKIPVILFPGSLLQLSDKADAVLLLSLLSGRNPEYLIGNHVIAAPYLKKTGIETISTGYILVGSNNGTAVEYMSGTKAIPSSKSDIIVATAMAGEMIGVKLIYLEAGSGAETSISVDIVKSVKENISIPLMVGGGIKSPEYAGSLYKAGADIIIIGNVLEENPNLIKEFCFARNGSH
jgi:phosphoglycerol geranylgeranyltransferase